MMSVPVVVWIATQTFAIGVSAMMHGKPREPLNFWLVLLGAAISNGILYWGGWFS